MATNSSLENYTTVVANTQTNGRGQRENTWQSEPNKNLTFSVFIKDIELPIEDQKYLNFAICLAVFEIISNHLKNNIFIKWPNDIMSANQKLCGILIENTISKNCINKTIVGIGLNVNQEIFSSNLKKISSLKKISGKTYDLELLLNQILGTLKKQITLLNHKNFSKLERDYLNVMYKRNSPSMFKTSNNVLFMGKILGVSKSGRLKIEAQDGIIKEFGIKEVSFA